MYRDQIRQNLQRILETTTDRWIEQPGGAASLSDSGDARPRVGSTMEMLGTRKTLGVESQDSSSASWQKES